MSKELPSQSQSVHDLLQHLAPGETMQDETRGSMRELSDLNAALHEHAIVSVTDGEGTITSVSERFCATAKYSREQLVGKNHRILNSGHHPPEFFAGLWKTIARGEVWHGEIRNRARDGTIYWVDMTIVPLLDESGKPRCYVAISADITAQHRAEESLRESDELFAKAFRLSPDCVAIVRLPERTVVRANDALCRLWGVAPDSIIGRETLEYSTWTSESERRDFMCCLEKKGECMDYETVLRLADGRLVDFSISSRLITFNGENCVLSVMRDITDRKRVEVATARLAAIVESSDDAIIGKDLDGIVTSWNSGAEKQFGYSAAEMKGQSIVKIIPPNRRHEEGAILEQIKRGENVRHFETTRVRKDGSEMEVSITVSAIKDASGHIVGASKVARDITERARSERDRKDDAERMHLATEATAVGIWEWHLPSNRIRWDSQMFRIYGITPTSDGFVAYSTWAGAVVAADLPRQEEILFETVRTLGKSTREFRIHHPGETACRFIEAVEIVRRDLQGNAEWVVGTNLDITGRKKAAEEIRQLNADLERRVLERTSQLEAANRELEAFSYSVSHDLRAPLRAVDGFSQSVIEDFAAQLPEDAKRQLHKIRAGAQKMGALIDDLLEFARLSRAPLNRRQVEPAAMAREVWEELAPQRAGRDVQFSLGDLPPYSCDPALMRQVWVNLLSNALKYSKAREHATIEVGTTRHSGETVYFVKDNGAGFDMRYAAKLFGVFQRLHRAEDYEGTGVGLAIVQRVIHRHEGRVWVEAALDLGATFYFTVPGGIV